MAAGGGHLVTAVPNVILSEAKDLLVRVAEYFVYIMSSFSGTIYTGITSDLEQRVREHKAGLKSRFTSKYRVQNLVYFEATSDVHAAIAREKQIKGWTRAKKDVLIRTLNPLWRDLSDGWPSEEGPSSLRSSG
jgi:putative endonuclease